MSPDNSVRIRFSTLMDTRSVIHGVTISPSGQGVNFDTTTAYPIEGTTFAFPVTPTPAWLVYASDPVIDPRFPAVYHVSASLFKIGQAYTVTIDSAASDIYGDLFGSAGSFSFTPEPYLRVTDTYPVNGDTAVSRSIAFITMRFNSVIDSISARSSFTLSPPVAGNAVFSFGSWGFSWSLPAGSEFASETKYTVTIGTSVKDVNGDVPSSPYAFSFTTAQ